MNSVTDFDTSRFPVRGVSWEEAMEFCRKLSSLPEEKAAGRVYRLPTEAEWEYACRAGTTTSWYCGDKPSDLPNVALFREHSEDRVSPVGQKAPNDWGLYDMHGNVWEWCYDWYARDYYTSSPESDPPGPSEATRRVCRGGSWSFEARYCRSAFRGGLPPSNRKPDLGFRVAAGWRSKSIHANEKAEPNVPKP
jgi:formylglycine-generating enzyme required for sulfatase activity